MEQEYAEHLKMKANRKGVSDGWLYGYYYLGLNDLHYLRHKISEGTASYLIDTEIEITSLRPWNVTGKSNLQEWILVDAMPCGDCSTKTSPCRSINCQYSKVNKTK